MTGRLSESYLIQALEEIVTEVERLVLATAGSANGEEPFLDVPMYVVFLLGLMTSLTARY